MSHPYIKLENTQLWHTVDTAISMLEADTYVNFTKPREHVIGFTATSLTQEDW